MEMVNERRESGYNFCTLTSHASSAVAACNGCVELPHFYHRFIVESINGVFETLNLPELFDEY
jgi:hypothetical protein